MNLGINSSILETKSRKNCINFSQVGKFYIYFYIGSFLRSGKVSGQLGFFSANWENILSDEIGEK